MILVIEDNDLLISTLKAMLKTIEKDFIIATSAQEAVLLYKKHFQNISIVLCDMFLHDSTGIEIYEMLSKINPTIKFILSSGSPPYDDNIKNFLEKDNIEFLQKPYTINEIITVLEKF